MVFSFFRKQPPPQKMPERPAAKPRPPLAEPSDGAAKDLPDLEFAASLPPLAGPSVVQATFATPIATAVPPIGDDEDFGEDFTDSAVMAIDVDHDFDPLQSDVEQAVVLFANGQDAAARALLETFIRAYPGREGLLFWHLLFDLLQVLGEREAFEQLGVRFAETCETSPPTWQAGTAACAGEAGAVRRIALQGVLTAGENAVLSDLRQALAAGEPVLVECGKLLGCDDEVADELARLLRQARSRGLSWQLDNVQAFLRRLGERLPAGQAEHAPAWLLLLELLQRHANQAEFEERAVDYAVTFELSPPSWETAPVPVAEPSSPSGASDGAFHLSGELKSCRFETLADYLESTPNPVIDCAGVRRIDFFSAGQLVNRIAPVKAAGREVTIRSPSHLVAELMAVVGLNRQARIIVPKS